MLPTITIAILQIALISRLVRREMVTNFAAPTSRWPGPAASGTSLLTWRYAMGNASVPVVTAWAPGSPPCSTASWSSRWSSPGPASAPWWSGPWKPATTR